MSSQLVAGEKMVMSLRRFIKPWLTAITRRKMSRPTRLALEKDLIRGKVLDYGCGAGTDAKELLKLGFDVTAYEPFAREPYLYRHLRELDAKGRLVLNTSGLPDGSFDTILLNYVLNVVPNPEERERILRDVFRLLKSGGCAIVSVRGSNVKHGQREPLDTSVLRE